jgi:shikimate kinase
MKEYIQDFDKGKNRKRNQASCSLGYKRRWIVHKLKKTVNEAERAELIKSYKENKEAGMVGINSHFQYVIDTDDLIESMENRAIKKIFAVDGEAYFRNLEKKTALWLESSVENTIISTGGGFYRQENLKNIGTVIYLKSSFDGILKRIKKAPNAKNKLKKRPLLQNKKEAMKLYDTRVKEYERVADIIVDVENRDLKLIVKEILGQIK